MVSVMVSPLPANELQRLQAVRDLQILDTPNDPNFDTLVELAVELLGMKIGFVSIIDQDRQWFRAQCGYPATETPREHAFCAHTIMGADLLIVEDATLDERFAANPLVAGEPNIRFYAGAPLLVAPDIGVGSLCVIDDKPRRLSEQAQHTLRRLADVATALLLSHQNAREMTAIAAELEAKHLETREQAARLAAQTRALEAGSLLANMGAWELDLRTGVYSWSESMYRLHGVDRSYPLNHESLNAFYEPEQRQRLQSVIERSLATNGDYQFEGEIVTPGGDRKYVRLSASVEFKDGVPIRRFGWKQDITAEYQAKARLTALAERDPLTGLFNRQRFKTLLNERLGEGRQVSVLLLDLDGFKGINDSYGHAAGDAFLVEFAHRLSRAPVGSCSAARLGGDEFAICLAHDDPHDATIVAEWLLQEVQRPWVWQHKTFELTTSIGIVGLQEQEVTPEHLLQCADLALYAAKHSGKNRYAFFDPSMREAADRRMDTLHAFRDALRSDDIILFYQPKVDLRSGEVRGLEALLRWQRSDGSVRAPATFVDALNDPGLAEAIGARVLSQALQAAQRWVRDGVNFGAIAVNLSAFQFRDPALADWMLEHVSRSGIHPTQLEVEITEEVLLSRDAVQVLSIVEKLRAAGVRVAFDDFGTGFASLTHLSEFPVDIIKIDRSFVNRLEFMPKRRAITNSIVNLARTLDIEVVAEGIETADQRELLRAMGCNTGQGYLFARPASEATITSWLRDRQATTREPNHLCFDRVGV
jgi:diguanylate cyclase (GGDEF)-like protein